MYKSIDEFSFLKNIVQHNEELSKEFFFGAQQLGFSGAPLSIEENKFSNHLSHWSTDTGIEPRENKVGLVADLPLYKEGFPIKDYDPNILFPKTMELLCAFLPKVSFACFVRTAPHSGIGMHTHSLKHNIFHLLLNDLEKGIEFTVNGEKKIMKKMGDHLIFDYSLPHATLNLSNSDRYGLMIDLK